MQLLPTVQWYNTRNYCNILSTTSHCRLWIEMVPNRVVPLTSTLRPSVAWPHSTWQLVGDTCPSTNCWLAKSRTKLGREIPTAVPQVYQMTQFYSACFSCKKWEGGKSTTSHWGEYVLFCCVPSSDLLVSYFSRVFLTFIVWGLLGLFLLSLVITHQYYHLWKINEIFWVYQNYSEFKCLMMIHFLWIWVTSIQGEVRAHQKMNLKRPRQRTQN